MEAATDLGAAGFEVSAIQHYDLDLLLHRKVLRPLVRPATLTLARTTWDGEGEHVVEKEKLGQRE